MYNLASKLLGTFVDPLLAAIVLAACGLVVWKRRRLAAGLLIVSLAVLLVFSSTVGARALVRTLEGQYRDTGLDVPAAQAIVVLGGTVQPPSGIHHSTGLIDPSDRLLRAFELYRSGKAPLVFCSGGNNPIGSPSGQRPESAWMARLLEEWGVPPSVIETEDASINTHENAVRSYRALAPRGIRRILLVTSAMHMPRAAGAFRKAGFEVVAAPADFRSGRAEPDVWDRWTPKPQNLVDSNLAWHEWLGIAIYRLRGWI